MLVGWEACTVIREYPTPMTHASIAESEVRCTVSQRKVSSKTRECGTGVRCHADSQLAWDVHYAVMTQALLADSCNWGCRCWVLHPT